MKIARKMILTAVAIVATAPSPTFACAACFGKSDSPLAHGMNWGIFTLMSVIVTVLASIATFFFFVIRKEIALNKNQNPSLQQPFPNPAKI